MMVRPSLLALAAQTMLLAGPVFAQAPAAAPPPPTVQETVPADPSMTGATTVRPAGRSARPAPPAASRAPRQPRPYGVCRDRARERGLRGGDRRSFITRCQLGFGGNRARP
jgi:hypothetical protein